MGEERRRRRGTGVLKRKNWERKERRREGGVERRGLRGI